MGRMTKKYEKYLKSIGIDMLLYSRMGGSVKSYIELRFKNDDSTDERNFPDYLKQIKCPEIAFMNFPKDKQLAIVSGFYANNETPIKNAIFESMTFKEFVDTNFPNYDKMTNHQKFSVKCKYTSAVEDERVESLKYNLTSFLESIGMSVYEYLALKDVSKRIISKSYLESQGTIKVKNKFNDFLAMRGLFYLDLSFVEQEKVISEFMEAYE